MAVEATGRKLGAFKSAARKVGCTLEEWHERRERGERHCFRCRKWKPCDLFSVDASRLGGRTSSCKECTSDASTASRYGMTLTELTSFRETHEHKCGICGNAEILYIDHDHATSEPRGLLCPSCNTAIGLFREDPQLFAAALAYLEKHRGCKHEN